ncbi:MAG: diacylglycerol kinase family lipid kinase [Actinomycetota bacterium]|nr:diacylglycerol kinase family lipid kinase [Actinomycetota bacterium]
MSRPVALIVNPAAGGGRAASILPAVESALERLEIDFHTERTRSLEHAEDLARAAVAAGEIAATLSGDGLVGRVAGVLADSEGILAILPGGRGNDLARVLGIPHDPPGACAVIADGRVRELDVGDVGGRSFIGIASCGFDSEANRIANETALVGGRLVYAYGALRALAAWKPARFELELDGRPVAFTGYSVIVANSRAYGGGMYIAPDAELDDGLFDVVLIGAVPKRRFLLNLPKVFKGSHVRSPTVQVQRAREVRVSADRAFAVYADGDPIGEIPLLIRARRRVLQVCVPG